MSAIALQGPYLSRNSSHGRQVHRKISSSWTKVSSKASLADREKDLNFKFDRLQQADQVAVEGNRFECGKFLARETQIDEEYWAAAWLRAEAHWEERETDRYADNFKRKFAEQEFQALRIRCNAQVGDRCNCIVMVKEDGNVKRDVLKSVVGTLDLSYGYLSFGESFPGNRNVMKHHFFGFVNRKASSKFGYIANLCVAKSARRKGIARNMLQFTISLAKKHGVELVFVHVHWNNKPAQVLYQKMGFKVVNAASFQRSSQQTCLLCLQIQNTD